MNRREALKNMGMGFGYLASAPTLMSIIQSCQSGGTHESTYFFKEDEIKMMNSVVDIIIPKTDTPGASELNIPTVIDMYISEVFKEEKKELFTKAKAAFISKSETLYKKSLSDISTEEYEAVVAEAFDKSPEEVGQVLSKIGKLHTKSEDDAVELSEDEWVFGFLYTVRDLTINAYKINEYVGKNILAYDPNPGKNIGCISVEEATGGKAWAL